MKKVFSVLLAVFMCLTTFTQAAYAKNNLSLKVSSNDESYSISDKLYGLFIEDISYACDGGLVSNLVNNGSFEYDFNTATGWTAENLLLSTADKSSPMNSNNPTYASVTVDGSGTLSNLGFTEMYKYKTYERDEEKAKTADMGFKKGVSYELSLYVKNKDFDGTVSAYLNSASNKNNAITLDTSAVTDKWTKISAVIESSATEDGGLTLKFDGKGTICIDFVTLIPQNSYGIGTESWKYTTLRPDLYKALEQLKPAFIRFPGGCLAEGDSLKDLYDWKKTIGPLEERVQTYNLWRDNYGREYINTNAMGYHEYFQLCSDLGAKALPILNVGLICQGRVGYDAHYIAYLKSQMSTQEWEDYMTNDRQMPLDNIPWRDGFTKDIESQNINSREDLEAYYDTIALRPGTDEWKAYVQDILDLIEYANGDAKTTYWGAKRAENGRTEPFGIEYIGLGNENWGELYKRNFEALYKEVKAVYPDITIISSSGAAFDGEAFDYNWKWINENYADTVVDEHYYTDRGFLYEHNDRYDSYDRKGAHVFIGEYAVTPPDVGTLQTKANLNGAIEEAAYLTGVERNGDIVDMTSYAPTFAKLNAQCWAQNLIWFDSQEVILTPSYYNQMLFSNNYGSKYIKSVFANGSTVQDGIYESVTVDEESETLYIKLINTSGKKQTVDVALDGYDVKSASVQSLGSAYKSACNEVGRNVIYPKEYDIKADGKGNLSVKLDKYDVTVLRVAYGGNNDGSAFYHLPEFIDGMPSASKYYPPVIRIGVPCAVGAVAVIAAAVAITVAAVKKKKAKKHEK